MGLSRALSGGWKKRSNEEEKSADSGHQGKMNESKKKAL